MNDAPAFIKKHPVRQAMSAKPAASAEPEKQIQFGVVKIPAGSFRYEDITVNLEESVVSWPVGCSCKLTRKSAVMLTLLLRAKGRTVSTAELSRKLDFNSKGRRLTSVDQLYKRELKKRLKEKSAPFEVIKEYGVGSFYLMLRPKS